MRVRLLVALGCCIASTAAWKAVVPDAFKPPVDAFTPDTAVCRDGQTVAEAQRRADAPFPYRAVAQAVAIPPRTASPVVPSSATPVDIISDAALAYGAPAADLDRPSRVSLFDRTFVKDAAMKGHAELVYAKLALRRAARPETRQYAQRIINDQMAANSELRTLAEGKNIVVPTELDTPHTLLHQELARLTGDAFDAAYATHQVRSHVTLTSMFRQAIEQAGDAQVRIWATHRLRTYEQHLRMARDLAEGRKPVS